MSVTTDFYFNEVNFVQFCSCRIHEVSNFPSVGSGNKCFDLLAIFQIIDLQETLLDKQLQDIFQQVIPTNTFICIFCIFLSNFQEGPGGTLDKLQFSSFAPNKHILMNTKKAQLTSMQLLRDCLMSCIRSGMAVGRICSRGEDPLWILKISEKKLFS